MNTYIVTITMIYGYESSFNVKPIRTTDSLENVKKYYQLFQFINKETTYTVYSLEEWVDKMSENWEEQKKKIKQLYQEITSENEEVENPLLSQEEQLLLEEDIQWYYQELIENG